MVNLNLYYKSLKQWEWTGGVPKVDGLRPTTPGSIVINLLVIAGKQTIIASKAVVAVKSVDKGSSYSRNKDLGKILFKEQGSCRC